MGSDVMGLMGFDGRSAVEHREHQRLLKEKRKKKVS